MNAEKKKRKKKWTCGSAIVVSVSTKIKRTTPETNRRKEYLRGTSVHDYNNPYLSFSPMNRKRISSVCCVAQENGINNERSNAKRNERYQKQGEMVCSNYNEVGQHNVYILIILLYFLLLVLFEVFFFFHRCCVLFFFFFTCYQSVYRNILFF